ncbi:MAG: GuaB1 family IMP dehydrogenase-related protein [candidate division SR1 bacterium]|nr:GuaB1 family IMP dehydrogenase-related protein [candidate division SR1 bacterium]
MKFNNTLYENEELTYEDVFLFQNYFEGKSRLEIDVHPVVSFGTHIPIVSSNMNAVSGRRMAETLARYGGLAVLPQDMDIETLKTIITSLKSADVHYDSPITMKASHTIRDALGVITKRAHNCVIMIDDQGKALSIFKPQDLEKLDQFTLLGNINKTNLITGKLGISDEEAFNLMDEKGISSLPIVDDQGILKGILTKKNTIRNSIYQPTLDVHGKLDVAVAVGVNSFDEKVRVLYDLGIRTFVLDTAHGYQKSMIDTVKKFRQQFGTEATVIAGNVITAEATRALIEAGANGVKVGIGPGAMCTTRMKTGVGRPQFTAVYKCAQEAKKLGGFVRADGGVKSPRDMILALAAGANQVMIGTMFAGVFESVGDVKYDERGLMYKENYGMASRKAVVGRNQKVSLFELAKKQMFREGISSSKIYINPGMESVGDVVDEFMTGLRSSMTYVGANNLQEFTDKAIVGVQTIAGFAEGTPHGKIRK